MGEVCLRSTAKTWFTATADELSCKMIFFAFLKSFRLSWSSKCLWVVFRILTLLSHAKLTASVTPASSAPCLSNRRIPVVPHKAVAEVSKIGNCRCALYILTWKCASRHNGVQFHLSSGQMAPAALASLLFDPLEPQIIGKKHGVSQLFYLFRHMHLLSSDSFSSLIFSLLLFSSLTLPTSAFPSVHIVESLTSKLPSTRH